jgi:hypothetical protein
MRGDSVPNRNALEVTGAGARPRLLTQLPFNGLTEVTRTGLGVFATGAESIHAEAQVIPSGMEDAVSALSTSNLLSEQADDPECHKFKATSFLNGLHDLDDRVVLICIASSDGSKQVVVPKSLRSKVLYLAHYPPAVAHPGAHRMIRTTRWSFY